MRVHYKKGVECIVKIVLIKPLDVTDGVVAQWPRSTAEGKKECIHF